MGLDPGSRGLSVNKLSFWSVVLSFVLKRSDAKKRLIPFCGDFLCRAERFDFIGNNVYLLEDLAPVIKIFPLIFRRTLVGRTFMM